MAVFLKLSRSHLIIIIIIKILNFVYELSEIRQIQSFYFR
jgi:hypothetical protein